MGKSSKELNNDFFEEYKRLDALCRQSLANSNGVSEYITEMENDRQGYRKVVGWERDYKQLKKLRWMRNQLAHDFPSEDKLATEEDIAWLKTFRSRILNCTDPFALLRQERNAENVKNAKKGTKSISPKQTIVLEPVEQEKESNGWLYVTFGVILAIISLAILSMMVLALG